ncbi:MAG TPA: hypothetical protein VG271_19705 [Beijerinckiaceae bacterium]|jgi:hypothetical protein|nr:hypothetical protein [Beijerinckiaceae bacterium]
MTQFVFGSGTLVMKRTDVANAQPALLGTLQDISVDFDRKIESLLGQYNVAIALAGGELKISGKAKFARFQASQFNNLFLGQTLTAGSMLEMTTGEPVTPESASFTVVNGATFVEDLGVFYAATGVALTPVASSPSAGQYVAGTAGAGTYTTASADNGTAMICYYSYTTASGNKIVATNQLMGAMPTFALYMKQSFDYLGATKDLTLKLNACSSSKMSLAFSNQKFAVPEFDFQAQADASNAWGTLSLSE